MTLKIISSVEVLYTGEVSSVTLPGTEGEFTVLNNHASLLATLAPGTMRYTETSGSELSTAIGAGIVAVDRNVISVCLY